MSHREPLLSRLPKDTKWFEVKMEKEDLNRLRVINERSSWNILSDSTGRIDIAAKNHIRFSKNPPTLPYALLPNGITLQQYFNNLMKSVQEFRTGAGNPAHNLVLIILSASKEGPFTILEGNHTAMGLYFRYFIDRPKLPYSVHVSYVGTSMSMHSCQWYHQAEQQ